MNARTLQPSRALFALDGVYAARCDSRMTLRAPGREPESLPDLYRTFTALGVARLRIEDRIDAKLEQEERARALSCVAPLPFSRSA
jgi:hypothetical protein